MRPAGTWLRAAARRCCSPITVERLIDPIVSDMQRERAQAQSQPWPRRARVSLSAYASFWRAATWQVALLSLEGVRESLVGDGGYGARVVAQATLTCGLVTLACILVPLTGWEELDLAPPLSWRAWAYLVPQALAIGIPAAVLFGSVVGSRRTRTQRRLVLACTAGAALALAVTLAYVPQSNQSFRTEVWGERREPRRGPNEMTMREVIAEMRGMERGHAVEKPYYRLLRLSYHGRIALTISPLVFWVVGLTVGSTLRARRTAAIAVTTLFSSYYVTYRWDLLVEAGAASPLVMAWLPIFGALLLMISLKIATGVRWVSDPCGD